MDTAEGMSATDAAARWRRLEAALAGARITTWDWHCASDTLRLSCSAAEVFGLPPGHTIHRAAESRFLMHPEDVAAHLAQVESAMRDVTGWHDEFRIVRPVDGRVAWLEERATVSRDAQGDLCATGIVWDVTEQHEAAQRRDEFLAMLAHELRNPLAPILSWTRVLRRLPALSPAVQDARDGIERQAQHLSRLVDQLLDVAMVTHGRMRLDKSRVCVREVVAQAVEALRPQIEAQRHALQVMLPPEGIDVHADAARLSQAVATLLRNSATYTPPGGEIEVRLEPQGDEVEISVRDNGPGIEPEDLERVFDLFAQSRRTLDRAQGGLGVGLTLARRVVEMHGGRIAAESEGAGRGSRFIIRIPVIHPKAERSAAASRPMPTTPVKVLIVDDNAQAAASLATLLSLDGHQVRCVHDGIAAVAEARAFAPNVILLDIGLPGMDGYEVARRLRAEPQLRHVRIAALTGYGQESDRRRSMECGFDAHLVKPLDEESLARVLAAA